MMRFATCSPQNSIELFHRTQVPPQLYRGKRRTWLTPSIEFFYTHKGGQLDLEIYFSCEERKGRHNVNEQAIEWLADRTAIIDVVTAFAVALDTRDWDLFRTCLDDPIDVDYPDVIGVRTFAREDLIGIAQSFFGRLDATLHISTNHQVVIDGDRATCVSTLCAAHFLASHGEQPVQRQIGYYKNHLVRLDRWRIRRTEQHQGWTEGNPQVFEHAAAGFR
jgi:hypothetical protein